MDVKTEDCNGRIKYEREGKKKKINTGRVKEALYALQSKISPIVSPSDTSDIPEIENDEIKVCVSFGEPQSETAS